MVEGKISRNVSRLLVLIMMFLIICPIFTSISYAGAISVYADTEIKDNYGWTHAFGISYSGGYTYGVCCEPTEESVRLGAMTASSVDKGTKAAQIAYYAYTHPDCHAQESPWVYATSSCMRQALTGDSYSHHYQADIADTIWNSTTTVPSNVDVYLISLGDAQDMMFCVPHPQGKLQITKACIENQQQYVSASPNNYSLNGAEYGVYSNSACTNKLATLKTSANGKTNTITLDAGTYYVKEIKASKGFYLDKKIYTATVSENGYNNLCLSEKPGCSTVPIQKINKEDPGAVKGLEGAEFTYSYYDINNGSLEECTKQAPKYTWVFATKIIDGKAIINFDESYYVGGDELIKDSNGNATIPLGTFTIKETLATKGFACDEKTYLGHIYMENDQAKYEIDGKSSLTVAEEYQTVSIAVNKLDAETKSNTAQGLASLAGAEFEVYYRDYQQSEDTYIGTITTDDKGQGELTCNTNGDKLMPGYYSVKETMASSGYILNKDKQEVNARIKEVNTANFKYVVDCDELVHHTYIHKLAEDTGKQLPGAVLQILNESGDCIYQFTSSREAEDVIGLSEGKYVLHEISAAAGYCVSEDVSFEVKSDEQYNQVEMTDKTTKTNITKVDTEGEFVKGAKLQLCSKLAYEESLLSGDERYDEASVYEFTSNGDTLLVEKELVAGMTYILHEKSAPDGYLLADDLVFTVAEDGSAIDVEMVDGTIKSFSIEMKTDAKSVEIKKDVDEYIVEDKVLFSGLTEGENYSIKGKLMSKAMNQVMLDSKGEEISTIADFTADSSSGEVLFQYSVDADLIKPDDILVAYNRLYIDDESNTGMKLVGTDENIDNINQSINFYENIVDINTGDENDLLRLIFVFATCALGIICLVLIKHKKRIR